MSMSNRTLLSGTVAVVVVSIILLFLWSSRSADHPTDGAPVSGGASGGGMEGMVMEEGVVHLEPGQIRALGVHAVEAELAPLRREIRATGIVGWDETRLSTVNARFGGFVERLNVNFTGQRVAHGDPLLEIYSPALVSAQEELLSAIRLESTLGESRAPGVAERSAGLTESARQRLLLWEISPQQIDAIERSGEVRRTITLHAPFSGFVVEKSVQAGEAIEAGRTLYRLADLSTVWIDADIYEQDVRFVRLGDAVSLGIDAYPGEHFTGRVTYIHPEVRAETRSVRARIELPNPDHRVKPGMFVAVRLDAEVAERALLIPRDAVLYTGERAIVFVDEGGGMYRAREVTTGAEGGGRTQILSGLLAGERVVTRANFLLDADSRLVEAMEGMDMPGMDMSGSQPPGGRTAPGSGAGSPSPHEGH